jgi:hypothetical protein
MRKPLAAAITALMLMVVPVGVARAQLYALSPGDSANDVWSYPSSATQATDRTSSGAIYSAFNAGGILTVTLPANVSTLPTGWHISVVNDNGHQVTVQVNGTAGGRILYPAGHTVSAVTTAAGDYEFLSLEYDNGGNFRVTGLSPQTAVALGLTGAGGSGNVTGPAASTDGWAATWSGTTGKILTTGHPVGNAGANTVMQTDSSGRLDVSTLPTAAVTGPGNSTDGFVARWSGTTGTVLSTGSPFGNSGANTMMETDSSGHLATSTLNVQSSGSGGQPLCINGSTIYRGSGGAC